MRLNLITISLFSLFLDPQQSHASGFHLSDEDIGPTSGSTSPTEKNITLPIPATQETKFSALKPLPDDEVGVEDEEVKAVEEEMKQPVILLSSLPRRMLARSISPVPDSSNPMSITWQQSLGESLNGTAEPFLFSPEEMSPESTSPLPGPSTPVSVTTKIERVREREKEKGVDIKLFCSNPTEMLTGSTSPPLDPSSPSSTAFDQEKYGWLLAEASKIDAGALDALIAELEKIRQKSSGSQEKKK